MSTRFRELTTKDSRVVKRQRKLRGNDLAKPSCPVVPRNGAKANFAPSKSQLRCRKFALKRQKLPEVVQVNQRDISESEVV